MISGMRPKEFPRLGEIPPEEHAIGIYAGLALGGLILGTGATVLFRDLLIELTTVGLKITLLTIFRMALFLFSAYASLACFFGLFRMISMQRMLVREVDREFKDFVMYARPLVEEIIKQRIVGEAVAERLERLLKRGAMREDKERLELGRPLDVRVPKWGEFLVFVALLANITIGMFIFLERHPWELVPYTVLILAVAWWAVIARYFGVIYEARSYYFPAIFILVMPTLSILLRAYVELYQTLYLVFIMLFLYIVAMYFYFKYMVTAELPGFLVRVSAKAGIRLEKPKELPFALRRYMPAKKPREEEKFIIREFVEKVRELVGKVRK
jgi:MFS family permease